MMYKEARMVITMSNRNRRSVKECLLFALLDESVKKCYQEDSALICRRMEQASVARVFYYMQKTLEQDKRFACFSKLNLDCEYNKNGQEIKRTLSHSKGAKPDIVLHKRGENGENQLVVEFKAGENPGRLRVENDYAKLKDFTAPDVYNYCLGVYVKLSKNKPEYAFFQHGKKIETNKTENAGKGDNNVREAKRSEKGQD